MAMSLLKPLSEIFNISISELLNGERIKEVNEEIINNTITNSVITYQKNTKRKTTKKYILITIIAILSIYIALMIVSEINYGIIPLGKNAYMDFANVSSLTAKKQSDKFMNALIDKDINYLDQVITTDYFSSAKDDFIEKEYKELTESVHQKTYKENLSKFYSQVEILDYKYTFFYYNGTNYAFDYNINIKIKDKTYNVSVQLIPYKEKVKLFGFGGTDDEINLYSEEFNLLYSVFGY